MARLIDIHEPAIVAVLDLTDEGVPYVFAVALCAAIHGLERDRLDSLIRCWCGIAGIPHPGDGSTPYLPATDPAYTAPRS